MSYSIKVSKTKTPAIFQALVNVTSDIRVRVNQFNYESVAPVLEKDYGIILRQYEPCDGESGSYGVEFASERDYLAFLLKWA